MADRVLVVPSIRQALVVWAIHEMVLMIEHQGCGRDSEPTAGVLDRSWADIVTDEPLGDQPLQALTVPEHPRRDPAVFPTAG
jgi:hypothetical protein